MDILAPAVLLNPLGLLGLLSLAIPVIIHLVSRSKGRRVLVGNIGLLRQLRQKRVSEIRLEQRLLLLLRCMILILATLVLAALSIPGEKDLAGTRVYLTPAWLAEAGPSDLEQLDELEYPARVLAPGFPNIESYEHDAGIEMNDAWPLLAEALASERHTGQVRVLTTGLASEFGPRRIPLPTPVDWLALSEAPDPPLPGPRVLLVIAPGQEATAERVEMALELIRLYRLPDLVWQTTTSAGPAALASADRALLLSGGAGPEIALPVVRVADPDSATRDPGFPVQLLGELLTEEERKALEAHLPVQAENLTSQRIWTIPLPGRLLQPWLMALILALWAAERWLSERRDRPHG